jgi:acyl-CoA thioesterase-1
MSRLVKFVLIAALAVGVVVGVWRWASHESPYAIVNEHPTGKNIIAFGDSLTEGVGATQGRAYPQQLAALVGVPILNKGVRGNTTGEALARLDRDVLGAEPRIVLLLLGGNDLLRRVPREETVRDYEAIVRAIQAKGALVIVATLEVGAGSELGKLERDIARRTGCPIVRDILGGIMGHEELMSDPIHPNERGYTLVAERIAPVLKVYLK